MLFQQPVQRQVPFERPCASPLLLKSNSSSISLNSSVELDLSRLQCVSIPITGEVKKSYKALTDDLNDIIAPAPKKPHRCGERNLYRHESSRFLVPWHLSTLEEDSDEDTFESDLEGKLPEWTAENDAYAELLHIVNQGSLESISGPPCEFSAGRKQPARTVQPMFIERQGIRFDGIHDDTTHGTQTYHQFLGRSPICRTQNPLPLDSMFTPKDTSPGIPMINSQNDLSPISRKHVDEIKPTLGSIGVNQRAPPLPFSFHKIHLRPRSLSVGARSGQAGVSF